MDIDIYISETNKMYPNPGQLGHMFKGEDGFVYVWQETTPAWLKILNSIGICDKHIFSPVLFNDYRNVD